MAERYNYSIIIPHKNIPKLLERCLWSIPRRKDLQIIVVDDNSDPLIVDFDNFPGLNDPAVEVYFTKEGKGAGYARNVGLSKAEGRMLLFADADDFFNYCIHDILEEYKDCDTDIVYFKSNSVHSEYFTSADRGVNFANELIDRFKDNPDKYLFYIIHVVWCKLFNRTVIANNNITFSETPIANDIMFSVYSTFYAETVTVDNRALYCYTFRSGSIRTPTARSHSPAERLTDMQENWKKRWFLGQHNIHDKYFDMSTSIRLLNEYVNDRENFRMAKQGILSLGFTKEYIRDTLVKAAVWKYVIHPMQLVYYRIKKTIK